VLKSRRTISSWLTNRYLLIIRNEENFAEKTTLSFNYAKLIVILFGLLIVLLFGSLYLSRTLLAQWFDPRHELIVVDRYLVTLADKVDSLENEVRRKDQFIQSVKRVLNGDTSGDDTTRMAVVNPGMSGARQPLAAIDSQFRTEFEAGELAFLTVNRSNVRNIIGFEDFFYPPIKGIVTRRFDLKIDHFGVDIVSGSNEPIKAVSDGMVIFSDWTQESGNVVAIQHRGNLISVYKHNSALLKRVGNYVNSGEVIAIIGNSGELTTGPHLHFELWYNGKPINPEEFISF
jgi:murein DD-endopeptidase MepM/ murein hydrolase activator NlpD